jgi:hypothetical protein
MNLDQYATTADTTFHKYQFDSIGSKGIIKKMVEYTPFWMPVNGYRKLTYNLGFGDYIESTGTIDDSIITNNGDMKKVLTTVSNTVIDFTNRNPNIPIFVKGSNDQRTRVYGHMVSRNLSGFPESFMILGTLQGSWVPFSGKTNFDAYLLINKQ